MGPLGTKSLSRCAGAAHREGVDTPLTAFASAARVEADGIYLGWGSFTVQLGNLIVIVAMIVLFIAALLLPFPGGRGRR